MSPEETNVFTSVLEAFQEKYPHRNIRVEVQYGDRMISVDNEIQFNLEGYNLLYNLKRLCDALEDELL